MGIFALARLQLAAASFTAHLRKRALSKKMDIVNESARREVTTALNRDEGG